MGHIGEKIALVLGAFSKLLGIVLKLLLRLLQFFRFLLGIQILLLQMLGRHPHFLLLHLELL
ncbi:hypothetical protein D3C80_2236420 [compost metagenome]